jgi:hypothetical protein
VKRFLLAFLLGACCSLARAQTPAPQPSASPLATPAPLPLKTPSAKTAVATKTLSASAYRALLQNALDRLKKLEKHPPLDARPVLKPLDTPFLVKRADGQSQIVRGDEWNRILSGISGSGAASMTRPEARSLEEMLGKHLKALDAWTTKRNGAYYAAFDAQKVVDDAVSSGRIRVAPPPAQQWAADLNAAIGNAISNFWKWLTSLLPKPTTPLTGAKAPNLAWLWFVFWGIMIALLGLLLFLAARALSGGSFSMWGIGRRRRKGTEPLRDEDAALFGLAPEELRDRADAFAASGNFREALRHRFISVLVLLDARGTWRYDIRRTNWEHIAGLRREEAKRPLVAPLSTLTRAFDRVRYGGAPCDEEGWNEFQASVREVESLVGGRAQRLEVARS